MAASEGSASGGFLRGHSVAFALIAIFAGMALAVSYAASDGAIFGLGTSSSSDGGFVSNGSTGGAAVISRDSFEQDSVPVEQDETSLPPTSPPESGTTLSEEERELLALSDFPWDSVAGRYLASNQDSMDRFRKPVPVQPGTDPLAISDAVVVNVDRARDMIEDEEEHDIELADIIDIDIPIDTPEDEEEPSSDEQEQSQDEEEQQEWGNEEPDGESSGEESGDNSESGDDDDQSQIGGNSTDTENSTSTQQETSDSGSVSEDSDSSNDTEATVTIE